MKRLLFLALCLPLYAGNDSFPLVKSPGSLTGQASTLNGGINNSVTSLIVTSSSGFPATPFVAQIGTEDLKVTTVSGTTWTVTRAFDGTSAASHSNADPVTELRWQWINQGSTTADTVTGSIYLTATAVSGSHSVRMLKKLAPTGSYSVMATVGMLSATRAGWDSMVGIVWRESSSGKLFTCHWENASGASDWFASTVYWTSVTVPNSTVVTDNYRQAAISELPLLRARDDTTNRYCDVSMDGGAHWINFSVQGRTVNLTADEIGFFTDSYQAANTPIVTAMLSSWVQSW